MFASPKLISLLMSWLALIGVGLSACRPAGDVLSEIKERGTIRISTDRNYAPQSELLPDVQRPLSTKCSPEEWTANQLEGFDIDTAVEIARRLGVEACFVTPKWEVITAGNWGGKWDISVGSMTIKKDRMQALWFSPPYYFTLAQLAARTGSGIASVADVAGQPVCVGTSTTYEDYLSGKDIGIPDSDIKVAPPRNVTVVALETDAECAQAIQAGRTDFDAFMTASNVVDKAIADGIPVEKVGPPVFVENLAVAFDKQSPKDSRTLLDTISKFINGMHTDGALKALSMKWYGLDRTVAP